MGFAGDNYVFSEIPDMKKLFHKVRVDEIEVGDTLCVIITDPMTNKFVLDYKKVEHIMLTKGSMDVVLIGDTKITKNHPILIQYKTWHQPFEMSQSYINTPTDMYSFAFEKTEHGRPVAVLLNDNLHACTLAHGLTDNVIEHDFYGTERVINWLGEYVKTFSSSLNPKTGVVDITNSGPKSEQPPKK